MTDTKIRLNNRTKHYKNTLPTFWSSDCNTLKPIYYKTVKFILIKLFSNVF